MTDATSLKQRLAAIPLLGGLLIWCKGIVRMNAHRRQNSIDHAHFQALHNILEGQLDELRRQHNALAESQRASEARIVAELGELRRHLQEGLQRQQEALGALTLELHHKLLHEQEQIVGLVTGHIRPMEENLQALRQRVDNVGESLLQAEAGQDLLTDRINGLAQAWRRQSGVKESAEKT